MQAVPVWLGTDGRLWPIVVASGVFLLVVLLTAKRVLPRASALWVTACVLVWGASHITLAAPWLPWAVSLLALWVLVSLTRHAGALLARLRPAPRPKPIPEVHPPVDPEQAAASPGRTLPLLPVLLSALFGLSLLASGKEVAPPPPPPKPAPVPAAVWDRVDISVTLTQVTSPHTEPHQVAQIEAVFSADAPSEIGSRLSSDLDRIGLALARSFRRPRA